MAVYSIDVTYAYTQLGLEAGATSEDIEQALKQARAYTFSTRQRVEHVRRFVDFFSAREKFAEADIPFTEIRKIYHKKAMALHPDRNRGSRASEDELKTINAAFHIVEAIYREAKDHSKRNKDIQDETAVKAREAREREAPRHEKPREKPQEPVTDRPIKYFAASVPRNIRNIRLSYIPTRSIIGSWYIEVENDINQVFDVIMLPEKEFMRARILLGTATVVNPALQQGSFTPAYVLQDIKELMVPAGTENPDAYAREHFLNEFRLIIPRAR